MLKIVVDANVWIRFLRNSHNNPIVNCMKAYDIEVITNNYLLSEVFDALVNNKWMSDKLATQTIEIIRTICTSATENAVYGISPDPEDNYLFDLAIQNNCSFLVSNDTELLNFKLKPIPVYTSNWFLKHFPL
jgi:putative PIN family toxin of toxin-antitoxin system